MPILLSEKTNVLIQGITGKEGSRALAAMSAYGTTVCCGVTPGKGGQQVEGVPVFNSVEEACQMFPSVNTSVVYVPPVAVLSAVRESIAAGIPLITIVTERIPVRDVARILSEAKDRGVRILGPSSIGCIVPGVGRLGVIGGPNPTDIYTQGSIGIISRSGGMANELSWVFRRAGMGQSAVVGIGGDQLIGTTFGDLLYLFEQDSATKAIVVFGEVGGDYEYEIAELLADGSITKPVLVYIGGRFGSMLPEELAFGHAGSLVSHGRGSVASKEEALRAAGALVAHTIDELPDLARRVVLT